ncbi:MAG: hypothetical protein JNK64_39785 [Myxococcales bacterium]|nr:hypothetical protein [Myxococcales bacterium]
MLAIELTRRRGLDGHLTIRWPGQPPVVIEDELWHQLIHLTRALAELRAGRGAAIPYASMPGGYQLAVDGDDVVIAGDHVATCRLPRAAFASALLAAADRWSTEAIAAASADERGVAPLVVDAVALARAVG